MNRNGRSGWSRTGWLTLGLVVGLIVAGLIGWPLSELVVVAAGHLEPEQIPGSVMMNTLLVGSSVAALSVLVGAAAAFLTEQGPVAGRKWLRFGVVLPVLIPPFVSAMSWLRAYGPSGILDDSLGISMPGLIGPVGVIVVISVNAMPLTYVLVVAALRSRAGRDAESAARVSGAHRVTAFRTITLPLLAPALLGAGALAFVVGINAFGVPAVLGTPARFTTVTTRIYQDLAFSARPEAFSRAVLLAVGLVLLAGVFVIVAEMALADGIRHTGGPTGARVLPRRPRWWLSLGAWLVVILATVGPLVSLVLVALTRAVGLDPVPANWTLVHFGEALDERTLGAMFRSLFLAFATASLAVCLGAAVAALRRRRFGRLAGAAVLLTFAVPGSTLAVAMLLGYGSILRDTLLIILLAYVAKLWAVGHRVIAGSAANLSGDLVRASRASGASPSVAIRTIVVPLLRPALVGAWMLVFLIAFHELTMSSLLYGPGTDTLAVTILNLQQLGDVSVSSALAVLLTLPMMLIAAPLLASGRYGMRATGGE